MYLTAQDNINRLIDLQSIESDSQALWQLIDSDMKSKSKIEMQEGEEYFINEAEIDEKDFRLYYKNKSTTALDLSASNIKAKSPDHNLLVTQKVDYIFGQNPTITIEPEVFRNELNQNVLTDKLYEELREQLQGASNKGVEWLHPFVNENSKFDYTIINARECIPSYETQYLRKLDKMYRYYSTELVNGSMTKEVEFTVEIWDDNQVTILKGKRSTSTTGIVTDGNFEIVEQRGHFEQFNTTNPDDRSSEGWGEVPFIRLRNNNKEKSDLIKYKGLIDGLNLVRSKGVNTLADIQEVVYIIKGYNDRAQNNAKEVDPAEYVREKLKTQKVAFVDAVGGVDAITAEVPIEATKTMIEILKEEIYEYGQGVRVVKDKSGNQTGVGLTFQYSALQSKAKPAMRSLKQVINTLIKFYQIFLEKQNKNSYPDAEIDITFNTSMIVDEAQLMDNLMKSSASLETKLKNDPFVEDVEEELAKIKQERLDNSEEFEPVEE